MENAAYEFFDVGSNLFEQGDLKEALIYFKKALTYFKQFNDKKTADTSLKIGEIYSEMENLKKAEKSYLQALKLYSHSKDDKGEAYAYTGLGIIYEKQKDHDRARRYYGKALKKFHNVGDSERKGIMISQVASTYESQGAWEDALMEYNRSSQIFEDIGHVKKERYLDHKVQEVDSRRSQVKRSKKEVASALIYLALLVGAELIITYNNYIDNPLYLQVGLALMSLILFLMLLHSSFNISYNFSVLLRSMMVLPIIRIVGLSIPLMQVQALYWFPIISIPLFAASYTIMRIQNLSKENVGLIKGNLPVQFLIAATGVLLGAVEFMILHPQPLIPEFNVQSLIIASIIIIISTGFAEELLFRGIIQKNAENVFGKLWGLLYMSLLFTALHIGWNNFYDLIFVFLVAMFYGYAFQKTRSILGITLSHGLSNTVLFLIMPFLVF